MYNGIFYIKPTISRYNLYINKTIKHIPKEKYRNIIKGAYERPEKYVSNKNKTRKIKNNYL